MQTQNAEYIRNIRLLVKHFVLRPTVQYKNVIQPLRFCSHGSRDKCAQPQTQYVYSYSHA